MEPKTRLRALAGSSMSTTVAATLKRGLVVTHHVIPMAAWPLITWAINILRLRDK